MSLSFLINFQLFYNTQPGNEVGLFYNASEPTRGGINYKMMNMITSVSVASMFSSSAPLGAGIVGFFLIMTFQNKKCSTPTVITGLAECCTNAIQTVFCLHNLYIYLFTYLFYKAFTISCCSINSQQYSAYKLTLDCNTAHNILSVQP